MMDAVTLTLMLSVLLPSLVLGKPFVTESVRFVLKAPDNDTGTWMWKTANSKVYFRHFHHAGDDAGKGNWTLEVTHTETLPEQSQKVREVIPDLISTNQLHGSRLPYVVLVDATRPQGDIFQQQTSTTTSAPEEDKSSAEMIKEFLEALDSVDFQEKLQSVAVNSFRDGAERVIIAQEKIDHDAQEEENWWLPGEDLVDEEEDGYFHVRNVARLKLYSMKKDWEEARRKCQRDGGDLAVPDTTIKSRVIRKLLHRYPDIPASAVLRNQVYVGIHDPLHSREWITVKGNPFTRNLWASGEPDNETPGEYCVTFRTDGRVRDVPCFYSLPFVCEKPLPPLEQLK